MVTQETRNAYSEVFEFLKYIDRTELDRIPMEILQTIKENKNDEYNPKIDYDNINASLSNNTSGSAAMSTTLATGTSANSTYYVTLTTTAGSVTVLVTTIGVVPYTGGGGR